MVMDLRLYSKEELEFRLYLLDKSCNEKQQKLDLHKQKMEIMIQELREVKDEIMSIKKLLK